MGRDTLWDLATYDQALKVYTPERMPLRSAMITGKQGVALMLIGERLGSLTAARTAVHHISLALAAVREANDTASAAYFETVRGRAVALLNQLTRREPGPPTDACGQPPALLE